jgi:glycerol-3-phosphate cytidylyltransferase
MLKVKNGKRGLGIVKGPQPGDSMRVYTGGTFDLLHIGHLELLDFCRFFAGVNGEVIVSLNTDEFVEKFKGKKPIMTYTERKRLLLNIKAVDKVVKNIGGEDSKVAIRKVKPNVIVIGMDWIEKDYCKQMGFNAKWLNKNKISVVYVPRTTGLSTTVLKERVQK